MEGWVGKRICTLKAGVVPRHETGVDESDGAGT